jgi:hypothetical protein
MVRPGDADTGYHDAMTGLFCDEDMDSPEDLHDFFNINKSWLIDLVRVIAAGAPVEVLAF